MGDAQVDPVDARDAGYQLHGCECIVASQRAALNAWSGSVSIVAVGSAVSGIV